MAVMWRGDVPTLTLLNQLVLEALPLGLRSGPVAPFFQRDVYFDSADRALHRRGVTCRFRVRLDDTRLLTVRVVGVTTTAGTAETFEAVVPDIDGEKALAGTSEPARRLRALIEPPRLRSRVQFETERRVRRTQPRLLARGRYDIAYDVVTVRSGPLTQTFQELKIVQIRRGRPNLAALGQAFVERYNLRPLLVGKLERAEKALREIEGSALARLAPARISAAQTGSCASSEPPQELNPDRCWRCGWRAALRPRTCPAAAGCSGSVLRRCSRAPVVPGCAIRGPWLP